MAPPTAEQQRKTTAKKQYVELTPGRFVANFYGDYAIREVDLESCNPDVLKEFPTKEAAVAFEEECFQRKEKGELEKRLLHRIPKDMLTIQEHQKPPKPTADIADEHHERHDKEMKACYINELENLLAEQALTRKAMWQPNAADDCPVWHPATPDAFDTDGLDS